MASSPSVRGTQEGENGRGAASADSAQSARPSNATGKKAPAGPGHRLIDRVFTTDTLIALGAADCRVSQCPFTARTLGAGHHLLAIRRSTRSPCHTSAADAYKAVPWGACTRSRAGAAELARRVHRINAEERHPAELLTEAAFTLRAWWEAQSPNKKRAAMDPLHDLVREIQKGEDKVSMSPIVLTTLEQRLRVLVKPVRQIADVGITISRQDAVLLMAAEEQLRAEHAAESVGLIGRVPNHKARRQIREFARLKKVDSKILAHSGTLYQGE